MEVALAVAADLASVTAEGKLNILGIFDRLNAPIFPFALPQMFLAVRLSFSPDEVDHDANLRIELVNARDSQMVALQGSLRTPTSLPEGSTQGLINQIVGVAGLTFETGGAYRFRIFLNDIEQNSIHLYVNDASGVSDGG